VPDARLAEVARSEFDLTPAGMLRTLDLRRPVYLPTARYGHFGHTGPGYTWERADRGAKLRKAAKQA
jgi:S-adenosylmethionine synthetase